MTLIHWIDRFTGILIALFFVGCVVSYLRESRKRDGKGLRWLEWILIPPGYAALFILVQRHSIRWFALYPKAAVAVCVTVALLAVGLLIARKKWPGTTIAWAGGLLGMPVVVGALVLLGMYLRAPARYEAIRSTIVRLENTKGRSAPDFPFFLVESGEQTSLSAYQGRLVLLNVWATWCAPCLKEMPDLNRIQAEFGSRGLVVINLSDESSEKIQAYLAKNRMATTHGRVDAARSVPEFYQFGGARPTSFLIDPAGKVIETVLEAGDYAYFRKLVAGSLP